MTNQDQAREYANKIAELTIRVESGVLSLEQGRVLTDNYKWLAAKLDPETYGNQYKDKKEMETQQMHLEAIKELAEKDNHWIVELVSPDDFTCKQCGHKQES